MKTAADILVTLLCLGAGVFAWLRWLRVIQREHYLAGSTTRFAWRWWRSRWINVVLILAGIVGAAVAWWTPWIGIATAIAVGSGPVGLSVKGRTSPLNWTRRVTTLALLSAGVTVLVAGVGLLCGVGAAVSALAILLLPLTLDACCVIVAPFEERAAQGFVTQASERLHRERPVVVGITGSYGKTSTKNHLATLLNGRFNTVASPRSYNNRAGLARAVNEQLSDNADVFIAEMGTYGPGEIRDLVGWCPPRIAVMTAIGPVHLERFGSLEVTLAAKSEITEAAETVVINDDDKRLKNAGAGFAQTKRLVRASAERSDADVAVLDEGEQWSIVIDGTMIGTVPSVAGVQRSNVACAIGVAVVLGLSHEEIVTHAAQIRPVENRLTVGTAASGVQVIDDTFNANPAGAKAALELLERTGSDGRRVVVTPGMIELGSEQFSANQEFAAHAAKVANDLIIVGRTTARALAEGAHQGTASVVSVGTRSDAVEWVRAHLKARDTVLYENDFPDHYP